MGKLSKDHLHTDLWKGHNTLVSIAHNPGTYVHTPLGPPTHSPTQSVTHVHTHTQVCTTCAQTLSVSGTHVHSIPLCHTQPEKDSQTKAQTSNSHRPLEDLQLRASLGASRTKVGADVCMCTRGITCWN